MGREKQEGKERGKEKEKYGKEGKKVRREKGREKKKSAWEFSEKCLDFRKFVAKFPMQKYRKVLSFRKFWCVLSAYVLVLIPEEKGKIGKKKYEKEEDKKEGGR